MTQKDKQLFLKYLCMALPYGVKVNANFYNNFDEGVISTLKIIDLKKEWFELENIVTPFTIEEIKAYLRPMESMTEEEKTQLGELVDAKVVYDNGIDWPVPAGYMHTFGISYSDAEVIIDWLNAHHFDYRGLIEKGLALSTEEFNPYKD